MDLVGWAEAVFGTSGATLDHILPPRTAMNLATVVLAVETSFNTCNQSFPNVPSFVTTSG